MRRRDRVNAAMSAEEDLIRRTEEFRARTLRSTRFMFSEHGQVCVLRDGKPPVALRATREQFAEAQRSLARENIHLQVFDSARSTVGEYPHHAEFVVRLFLLPMDAEALLGDLEESFRKIEARFGRRKARFWFWWQTARSIWPLLFAFVKRAALWSVVGKLLSKLG